MRRCQFETVDLAVLTTPVCPPFMPNWRIGHLMTDAVAGGGVAYQDCWRDIGRSVSVLRRTSMLSIVPDAAARLSDYVPCWRFFACSILMRRCLRAL